MNRNAKTAILVGAALGAGIEHEISELKMEQQPAISRTNPQDILVVFGRNDHGPETWPYAPHTIQGVVMMATTSSSSG